MTSPQGGEDRRRFSRIPFDATVEVLTQERTWETTLLDVSLKGALLAKPLGWAVEPGEPCTLVMRLGAEGGVEIRMAATAAHEDEQRVGFRCGSIDLDSMTHLVRLVELNLGDASLLYRELAALVTYPDPKI